MVNNCAQAPPPPRTLNVEKFAGSRARELESLRSIVAARLNDDFRSRRNKRRRTNSYDDRIARKRHRKRRKGGAIDKADSSSLEEGRGKIPRRIRRRLELRQNPEIGFLVSSDGTKRLRTHVWHAKRFRMTKLWGFHLPLAFPGRGKGSRSLLKKFKDGALIHDASYCSAVQLEGPESSLLSILRMVLTPSASAHGDHLAPSARSKAAFGCAILHHVGELDSQPIGPVTFMWRPSSHQINISNQHLNGCYSPLQTGCCSSYRQLWVWLHASVFNEGYDVLKFACQKQIDETGITIKCFSLEDRLGKFEVMGLKAIQVLQKILQPVASIPSNTFQLERCSVQDTGVESKKSFNMDNEVCISSDSVISLIVSDPRSSLEKPTEIVTAETLTLPPDDTLKQRAKEASTSSEIYDECEEPASFLSLQSQNNSSASGVEELWDAINGIKPPFEEHILCMEKHQQRMDMFCLYDKNLQVHNSSIRTQCSRTCPILLFKNSQKSRLLGWSIVLPLSWAKAFWVPLVNNGAHAIGLTEKHWVACDAELPYFPSDFPDCTAYSCFMRCKATAMDEKLKLQPSTKRPFRIPIPPPWNSIGSHGQTDSKNCDASFDGSVARTDEILEKHCNSLLLFPMRSDTNKSISEILKNDGRVCLVRDGIASGMGRKSCFVRVLLRAFKEGVFEEGAVVCAPCLMDISVLTSRAGSDERKFQIPLSSVQSYFKEESPDKWVVQRPEDAVPLKSHRWPIGFVTTGFVRGSKKPVASAICGAAALSRLREEQWNEMGGGRREEIYVVARNLRSTAYRLALATVVLEQREGDVEFL